MAITPGPPALVTMPSLGPRGLETRESASLASNRSSISVDAHHAGAPEGGAVERVVAGDGAGVRGGGHGRAGAAARLHDDDRLGLGEVARGAHELARVGQRFDVEDDRVGLRVGAEVVDQVAEVDVAHRADTDEGREADLVGGRPVEDRRAQGAGLADEADAPGLGHDVRERRVEVLAGADVAEAVGADEPHAVRARRWPTTCSSSFLPSAPISLKPERDDDRGAHAGLAALADHVGHRSSPARRRSPGRPCAAPARSSDRPGCPAPRSPCG